MCFIHLKQRGDDMLLNIHQAAQELGCSPLSLYQKPFRFNLGLAAVKIGSRLMFHPEDIAKVVASGRERLPEMPEEGEDVVD
jgi:hypothetical protein